MVQDGGHLLGSIYNQGKEIQSGTFLKNFMEIFFFGRFFQCHRQYEKSVPRPRGVVRGTKADYLRAAASLIVFFCLIWGPWALFTFDHTVGKANIPYEVSVSLHVGSSEFYRMSAQTRNIQQ